MLEHYYISSYIQRNFSKNFGAIFITSGTVFINMKVLAYKNSFGFKLSTKDILLRYTSLVDLWCTDYLNQISNSRFEICYKFRSFLHLNLDIVYSTYLKSSKRYLLNSISLDFPSADWLEREIWDLYGIFFTGHSDLRRILTDYGFSGYPFRKDFPICGYKEIRYDDEFSSIISDPVSLPQNFRNLVTAYNSNSWV